MKTVFRISAHTFLTLTFIVFCTATLSLAQNREAHFISAQAGGVNFVAGDVLYRHADDKDWQRLSTKDSLVNGDMVRTGAGGQVEVLLNPGSYLRLGESSEFVMSDASLDSLRFELIGGSAIVEATGYGESAVEMTVETAQTRAKIIRSGIYRFNVLPSNVTEVAVRTGRALVGIRTSHAVPSLGVLITTFPNERTLVEGQELLVKGNRVARVSGNVAVAKLDKMKDALDLWSKARAKELTEANRQLAQRNNNLGLNSALSSMSFENSQGAGVWVFAPSSRCYTFLPFYYGWGSPYGNGYGSSLGYYPSCGGCPYPRPVVNNNPGNPNYGGGGTVGANPGQNPPGGGGNGSGGNASPPPMQRETPAMTPHSEPRESMGRTPREALPPR